MRSGHLITSVAVAGAVVGTLMAPAGTAAPAPAPATAPAACAWTMSALPLPAGYDGYAEAFGHAGTGRIVGTVTGGGKRVGVVWNNGTPTVLPSPRGTSGTNEPRAVNARGVIAGHWQGDDGVSFAWRYENGRYQELPNVGTQVSIPTRINDNGDIAGFSRYFYGGAKVYAVLWRTDRPDAVVNFGEGYARGLDDQRRVVLSTGALVDGDGKELLRFEGGGTPVHLRGGRVVGYTGTASPYTVVEWDMTGKAVRRIPGGTPSEITTSGEIVGHRTGGIDTVWRSGTTQDVTNPVPESYNMLGITDDGAVISDYTAGDKRRSGVWRSLC